MSTASFNIQPIPEMAFCSGQPVKINLNDYLDRFDDSALEFSMEDFPEHFYVDRKTGIITGTAPKVLFDTPFLVNITVCPAGAGAEQAQTEFFAILITAGFPEVDPNDIYQRLQESLKLAEQFDQPYHVNLLRYLEYMNEYLFSVIYIYDAYSPPQGFGAFQSTRSSEAGFAIYNFDNLITVISGDMAYASGNSSRILKTLREVYATDVPDHGWTAVGLSSNDTRTLGKAWVIAKIAGLNVSEEAPTDHAAAIYRRVLQLTGELPRPISRLIL